MNVPGEAYLFNLSVVAMTFAAVSVFVMLMRQSMGGRLSNYDIYLVTYYVSQGFVVGLCAMLPSLAADFVHSTAAIWTIGSGVAAMVLGPSRVFLWRLRLKTGNRKLPLFLIFLYTVQWILVLVLVVNAALPQLQGPGLFKAALTLWLAAVMLGFVRRIASLLGEKPSEDWDPKRA
jgi:hypothetical protein